MIERSSPYCPQCGAPTEPRERFGRTRPVCTVCDTTVFFDPKVAVAVFVTRQCRADAADQELLMIKRLNEPGKGKWSIPAGFVDPDEDPREADERETLEETGVRVHITHLIDVLHRPDPDGLADIVLVYAAEWLDGECKGDDDAEDADWFARSALPEIALTSTRMLVARWRKES